jgi:hypothetical protein
VKGKAMLTRKIRLTIALVWSTCLGSAATVYDVRVSTAPLIGHTAGPFSLELQFNDGEGLGDANNTAVLSNVSFELGQPTGLPSVVGGVTGDLGSSVTMTDSSFFNQFIQSFNPGGTLSFRLSLSTNTDAGGVPDEFSLAILDSSGVEIPTLGPANALLIIDINSPVPAISTFPTDATQIPNAGGQPIDMAAPSVSSAAPEPASWGLLATGLTAIMMAARSRRCAK